MNYLSSKVKILGTGSYAPEHVLTNEELARRVNTTPEWIFDNLGIHERRIAAPDAWTSDLATSAAERAILSAGIDKNEIDLLIVATATPDRKAPSTACFVQKKLGITNHIPAFDISAVCSGFLYAMTIGSQFIESGMHKTVLVIGADTFSKITDWNRRDCVFFGDGAGAVILRRDDSGNAFFSSSLFADGSGHDSFTVYPSDPYFTMRGKDVYETGTIVLPQAIQSVLAVNQLSTTDITWIVPHQPSIRILKKTAEVLNIPFDRVLTNMDRYANTSGATIPILLDEMTRAKKFKKDDLLVFAAVGSGWTWGAALYRWL